MKDLVLAKATDEEDDPYQHWGETDRPPEGGISPEQQSQILPSSLRPTSKRKEPLSDEEISKIKQLAPAWIENFERQRRFDSDARKNPVLHGEGRKAATLDEAFGPYQDHFNQLTQSDAYKNASPIDQLKQQLEYQRNFHQANPTHHSEDVMGALDAAREHHGLAGKARKSQLKEELQHMVGGPATGMSAAEAAAHLGTKSNDEDVARVSTISDPLSAFGGKHKELAQKELEHMGQVEDLTPEEEERLQSTGAKAPLLQHPAFQDPSNKKLIDDLYARHAGLLSDKNLQRTMHGMGIDEGLHQHIDMGKVADAAMMGILKGVHGYRSDLGVPLSSHVRRSADYHVKSELQRQHPVAQRLREKAKTSQKQAAVAASPVKIYSPEEKAKLQAQYAAQAKPKIDAKSLMTDEQKQRHQNVTAARMALKKPENQ